MIEETRGDQIEIRESETGFFIALLKRNLTSYDIVITGSVA
jgi:hypothetical protein